MLADRLARARRASRPPAARSASVARVEQAASPRRRWRERDHRAVVEVDVHGSQARRPRRRAQPGRRRSTRGRARAPGNASSRGLARRRRRQTLAGRGGRARRARPGRSSPRARAALAVADDEDDCRRDVHASSCAHLGARSRAHVPPRRARQRRPASRSRAHARRRRRRSRRAASPSRPKSTACSNLRPRSRSQLRQRLARVHGAS